MDYKSIQLEGFLLSEDEAQKFAKEILAQYRAAAVEIDRAVQLMFAQTAGMTATERYDWYIQYNRRAKLDKTITSIYTKHDLAAANLHVKSGKAAMSNNYYRQLYISQWVSDVGFVALNPKLTQYAVTGQMAAWEELGRKLGDASDWNPAASTLLDTIKKNRFDTLQRIRVSINTGVMSEKSYRDVARGVRDIIGVVKKGKASGQLAKALRIVRTEGTRLLNAGAYAQSLELEQQGIPAQKMWDASLDTRTRPEHGAADGQTVDIDKFFIVGGERLMFPGDSRGSAGNIINCRCSYTTLANGVTPEIRRGRDPVTGRTEVFSYQNYSAWAESKGLVKNAYGQYVTL